MKLLFKILILVSIWKSSAIAQNYSIESLKLLLEKTTPDSNRVKILLRAAEFYYFSKPDSCHFFSLQAKSLAKKIKMVDAEITALHHIGESLRFMGNYPASLTAQFEALEISRKIKNSEEEASSLGYIGFTYIQFGDYRQALKYLVPAIDISQKLNNKIRYTFNLTNTGNAYALLDLPDSALYYQLKAMKSYAGLKHGPLKSLTLTRLANAYANKGQLDSAMTIYRRALANCYLVNDKINISVVQGKMAQLFLLQKNYDSSIIFARLANKNANVSTQRSELMESSLLLSSLHKHFSNYDSALFYKEVAFAMKDSLYGPQKFKQLQQLILDEQQKQQQAELEQQQYKNKIKYIILFVVLGVFLLLTSLLFRNNRLQKRAKTKVESAYTELKETQQQLIQREKMASLGELTAGIAHEIQNPLNFVNNFSEVSTELVDEMNTELDKGNAVDAKLISQDLKNNLEKINHHGKRAGDIVKGMLQHSRSSSGDKEPTDINALADEYLRLAYHGLRAKDKSFNATLITDYDETIEKVNVIPQDIGRVILNLINNAFYTVNEKAKQNIVEYDPTVTVSTKKITGKIEISVMDNGMGIPEAIKEKIFQPFFTTKPTGQGTGLGLSLAYDILKAHGGDLKVNARENEGTEFIISLPA